MTSRDQSSTKQSSTKQSSTNSRQHHGEYKVPGGKLVVADLATEGGRIAAAKISGDFFLDPEDAFDALAPALVGASATEGQEALVRRLETALAPFGEDLDLQGFTLEDVGTVVRRALAGARDFADYSWEVVHTPVLPTRLNVALDQQLLAEVDAGRRGPTLRIWEWDDRAVVIGAFQSYTNELHPEGVEEHGVEVVRRVTGGGAMFMEGGNCITYSLYAPREIVAGLDYTESYAYLDRWVIEALAKHGVNAWYVPINDITSSKGKIGGAAQKRTRNAVIHHATMSYDIDADTMTDVLRIGKAKLSDKGIASAKKRVDPVRSQTGASREEIIRTMIETFTARYGASTGDVTAEEMHAARALVDAKFGTETWTHRVP
ncbi:lipoate--protein ligase family protein [Brevibacterium jeotgali]|uniref:Lipoate-protein ligase A n=1 Tax=Brevibacterium jeotgali TaxID=1262550 RepID=A0A2H1L2U8_9MICO|nr:biotin/lipoate A/B protein ligase family protein [Brevibacterium jeotgali]TWC02436.1 lipoate-protein ligase A [Brevibacterium jeotgali]SMY11228.1 lipoate-protein ligase A [Brevibacterium jeotgali]